MRVLRRPILLVLFALVAGLALPAGASAAAPASTAAPQVTGFAREGQTLGSDTGAWTGAEPITYKRQWLRCDREGDNCSPLSATAVTYTVTALDVGSTLRVRVEATNNEGKVYVESAATAIATGNPPNNTKAPVISDNARVGQTLSVKTAATWTGTQPFTFAYAWRRCDADGAACTDIPGATAATYRLTEDDLRARIRLLVIAANAAGTAEGNSAAGLPVGPAQPPVTATTPTLTGERRDGSTLRIDYGTWTGTPTITFTQSWWSCDTITTACTPISGATLNNYTLKPEHVGRRIQATITAVNADGSAVRTTPLSEPVAILPPASNAVPTVTGAMRVGQTLTARTGSWTGTPDLDYAHQWIRCDADGAHCAVIDGATQATYVLQGADLDARVGVRVTASNPGGSASRDSVPGALVIAAQPPVNTVLPAVSGTARDGQTLSSTTGTWTGHASFNYAREWLRCDPDGTACAPIAGATASGYKLTSQDVDHGIRVRIHVSNDDGVRQAESDAVRIAAAAPVATAAPTIAGLPRDEQRLTANVGTWTGTPTISYAYAWERCDATGAGCAPVPGAEAATYDLVPADIGFRIRLHITATNAAGAVRAASAAGSVVAAAPPAATALPSLAGTARDGQLLTAQRGTWTGTQPMAYTWQWRRCKGTLCNDIAGATEQTYRLTPTDVAATIRIRVSATNGAATVGQESAATAVVAADPPAATAPPTVSGRAEDGEMLTATTGTWTGTPTMAHTYQWQRCAAPDECEPITGATKATYQLTTAEIASLVRVRVAAVNGGGAAAAASDATARVAAVAPASTAAPAITGTARDGQALTAVQGTWSGTVPQDRALQWRRCDAAGAACVDIPGETSTTYRLRPADVDATIRLSVLATNVGGSAGAVSARTSLVVADPPVNTVAAAITGVPRDGRTLTVEEGVWTGTPAIRYAYRWQRCSGPASSPKCTDIQGAASRAYLLRTADVGSSMRVVLTAANAGGHAVQTLPVTGVVQDNPPVNVELPAVSGTVRDGEELSASDGDWRGVITFAFAHQWYRCNENGEDCGKVTGATGPTFTLTPTDVGLTLRVEVTARNAGGFTSAMSHATSVGTPRPPTAIARPRISGYTGLGQLMTGDDGGWVGSPPLAFRREWLRCDAAGDDCTPIADATGRSHQLTTADLGHRLRVRVYGTNAAGADESESEATRVVSNDPPVNRVLPSITSPSVFAQGVQLTAVTGEWGGAGPLEAAYRWRRCNALGVACADIPNATGSTYVPTADDLGQTLRVTVTMDNGVGAANATSAPVGQVLPAPPSLAVAPVIKAGGAVQPGTELSTTPGSWNGADPIAHTYSWLRCRGGDCVPIAGAGAARYVLTDADMGATVRVRVTATNPTLSASADSEPVGPVNGLAPSATGKPTVTLDGGPGTRVRVGTVARGDGGVWTGSSPVEYAYHWQRCASVSDCTAIPGADGLGHTLSEADIGSKVRLVVVVRNGAGAVTATSALTETVAGVPPAAVTKPVVVLASSSLRDGAEVSAEPGGWSGTGTLSFSYQWQRCPSAGGACKPIAKAVDRSYTATTADIGQRLSVLVSARSASGKADSQSAPTGVVTAVAPANRTRPTVQRPPGKLVAGAKMSSLPGTWAGSEKLEYAHQWLRCDRSAKNCRAIEGATKPIYDMQPADFKKRVFVVTLRVAVTARNPAGAVMVHSLPFGGRSTPTSAATPTAGGPAPQTRVPLGRGTTRFDAKGRLVVQLGCAKGGPACAGSLKIASPAYSRTLKFTKLRAGKARRWTLKLSRRQQRAAGRARTVRATLTATVTGRAGPRVLVVSVKVPAKVTARWRRIKA